MPGSLLMQLGIKSFQFLNNYLPIGTNCSLVQEPKNKTDVYSIFLAYIILPSDEVLNETIIKVGYAKPYDKIYCSELGKYQELIFLAKQKKKGLYSFVEKF